MTLDEAMRALTPGCCTREAAAESGCRYCVPKYAAMDWMRAAFDACEAGSLMGGIMRADVVYTRGYRAGLNDSEWPERIAELHRLREIERLARDTVDTGICIDLAYHYAIAPCGECAPCKLRAALESL